MILLFYPKDIHCMLISFHSCSRKLNRLDGLKKNWKGSREIFNNSKSSANGTFRNYRPSRVGTSEWDASDQLVGAIRHGGGIEYVHRGQHEHSHCRFKESCRLCQNETKQLCHNCFKGCICTRCKILSVMEYFQYIVQTWAWYQLFEKVVLTWLAQDLT